MYCEYNKETKLIEVIVDEDDRCFTCVNLDNCPLHEALQQEIAILKGEAYVVHECGVYIEEWK